MAYVSSLRERLALGAAAAALIVAAPAYAAAPASAPAADQPAVGTLVVTAQRKSEIIQRTPVAVSAFTGDALKIQRLDGGENLELAVPNMNYSRSNFAGNYSLYIRGIGAPVVGSGSEAGVSINENNLPTASNHFADTDFYDTERVEVVRGPVGTLYGRNATAGEVNVITNKPTDVFEGSLTGEYGNYNDHRFSGFINIPVNDKVAVRVAGYYLGRDGFGTNSVTGDSVDGRNLGSIRATISYKPNDRFSAYLMYEHYQEDDDRNLVGKQLCTSDPGPTSVGPVPTSSIEQGLLSQGCKDSTLYSPAAYGQVNTSGTIVGLLGEETGLLSGNANAGAPLQNSNLHDLASAIQPVYKSHQDIVDLHMAWDFTDHLRLESITGWDQNSYMDEQDYDRYIPTVPFNTSAPTGLATCLFCLNPGYSAGLYPALFPGGVVQDAQTGAANVARVFDEGSGTLTEVTQEFRVISSFNGPLNFSTGVNYYQQDAHSEYYVFFNAADAFEQVANAAFGPTFFIDNNNPPNNTGNNYYLSGGRSTIKSYAAFGELYYDINPDLKLTLGLRETQDQKYDYPQQSPLLVPGGGAPNTPASLAGEPERFTVNATTARANLEWSPQVSFTDHTMVYASYSRGYKGGGFNTPCTGCGLNLTFAPEYIDAFEVGTKNLLLGKTMTLNLTGFYYNYDGYQISSIVDKSSYNQNINARVYGVEFESAWNPVPPLTLNAQVGYLNTRISNGSAIDQANLTGGNPNLTVVKAQDGSNCVVNTAALAGLLGYVNTVAPGGNIAGTQEAALLGVPGTAQTGVCGGQYMGGPFAGLYNYGGANVGLTTANPAVAQAAGVGLGVPVNLTGRQLPNAPNWTVSVGAQYVWQLPSEWLATLRGDYYWQASSYSRIFNDPVDYLQAWSNVNMTLTFAKPGYGLNVQLFVKNLTDSQPITSTFVSDASAGLFSNTFTLDPRTFGVSVTKKFH